MRISAGRTIIVLIVAVCIAVPIGAVLLVLRNLDINQYRGDIEAYLSEEIGRRFKIGGKIEASLSWHPTIVGHDVTLANASWGRPGDMITVDTLIVSFDFVRLIFGTFEIESIRFSGGDLYLETDAQGQRNWVFENTDAVIDEADEYIDIRYQSFVDAGMENIDIYFLNGRTGNETSIVVDSLDIAASGAEQDISLKLSGSVDDRPVVASVATGALSSLSRGQPVPLSATINVGQATAKIVGKARDLIALDGIDFSVKVSGPDTSDLTALAGLDVAEQGAFDLDGRIASVDGGGYEIDLSAALEKTDIKASLKGTVDDLDDPGRFDVTIDISAAEAADIAALFDRNPGKIGSLSASMAVKGTTDEISATEIKIKLGKSDLEVTASVRLGDVPEVTIDLESGVFDVSPFLPEIDAEVEASPREERKDGRIFSDEPLPFDLLKTINVNISVNINQLIIRKANVDLFHTRIELDQGKLSIDPLELDYQKTTATARLTVDDRKTPAVTLRFLVQNFDLGRFLEEAQVTDLVTGDIDIGADVTGQGTSVRAIVGSLDGHFSFVMGQGDISSKYIDLLAVDLTKFLMPWRSGLKEAKIKCALGQFEIKQGVATAKSLLFDTKEMTMSGQGTINLGTEKLDILLKPRPKDPSLFSLSTNLRVSGTLVNPSVGLDALSTVGEVAEAVAAVLVLGPAGILVPFASLGAGDHHPCVNDLRTLFGPTVSKEIENQPQ